VNCRPLRGLLVIGLAAASWGSLRFTPGFMLPAAARAVSDSVANEKWRIPVPLKSENKTAPRRLRCAIRSIYKL
jgi:hypothetical protein